MYKIICNKPESTHKGYESAYFAHETSFDELPDRKLKQDLP